MARPTCRLRASASRKSERSSGSRLEKEKKLTRNVAFNSKLSDFGQSKQFWPKSGNCDRNSEIAATIPKLCAQFSNCAHNSGVLIAISKLRPQSGNYRRNFRIAARIPELLRQSANCEQNLRIVIKIRRLQLQF